jgi:hypothetical protein
MIPHKTGERPKTPMKNRISNPSHPFLLMFLRLPWTLAVLLLLGIGVVRAVNPEPGTVPPPTCPTCEDGEDNDTQDEDTTSGSGGCTQPVEV